MFKRRILTRKSINSGFEDIHHSCTVRFLDDSDPLTVTYQNDTKGQYLIDHVCLSLDLVEKDYFGLRYVDKEKQRHWIDPLKSAQKQLKDVNPPNLSFRVKFYPSDPGKIKEDITRYYLFLQLVRDLHRGRLLCSLEQAIQMSAYILQAEFGDYEVELLNDYLSQAKMIPKQIEGHESKVVEKHKALRGQTPAEIEVLFLDMASQLDTYGVDPQPVKDSSGASMYLGVTHQGVVTFQGDAKTSLFKWNQIDKLDFEGKHFVIILTPAEKKQKHDYKCPSANACKYLWKYAVQQRYFFTLKSSNTAPKVTAGRGFFRRGSSYRFRGHCQSEVFAESANINREAPIFTRWASNPQFFRASGSIGTGSLPNAFRSVSLTEDNIATFENSQSDISAMNSIRNSNKGEDSLLEESLSSEPPSVRDNHTALTIQPSGDGSGFLNHISEPLPPVEEVNGTPDSTSSLDPPNFEENTDLGEAEKLVFQDAEPSLEAEKASKTPQEVPQVDTEASTEPESPSTVSPVFASDAAELPCRSRIRAFIILFVLMLLMVLVLFETESLSPLLSMMYLESPLNHLRLHYYLPLRRLLAIW